LKPIAIVNWKGIEISSVIDSACMKLQTIGIRRNKKDFINMFFTLQRHPLEEPFKRLNKKYQQSDFSRMHILKSLVYFKDAEQQPIPKMHKKVTWEKVKNGLAKKVKKYSSQ